jgi:ABC-2 type transport system ATP-binding protein
MNTSSSTARGLADGADRAAIQAIGLVKAFDGVRAVDGIDLELPPGRIYGMLGPNGAGKTTLIRLLAGLARPTAGHAIVLGTPMPSRPALARIGYMTQADGLYGELSVWENLRFFAAMCGERDAARMRETLEVVELDGRRDTPVAALSGGLRRRLSLACALVHRPEALFLDEPTVGIDPVLRVAFWEHFHRLADAGTTLLVSSHVMDEAARCDDLVLMRAGRIVGRGSADDIRRQTGTDDLEAAFLRLAEAGGDDR